MRPRRETRILDRVAVLLRPVVGGGPAPQRDDAEPLEELRTRVEQLEAVVEGLQDAVYRQVRQHDLEIQALRRRTEPAEIARALSDDARRRGL